MCDEPGTGIRRLARECLADSFVVLLRFQIPEPRLDPDAIARDPGTSECHELSANVRLRPILRMDVGGAGEFSQRVEAATDKSHAARVIQVVPQNLVKDLGKRRG